MPRKRKDDPVTIIWENPPGPDQRIWIEREIRGHVYRREVTPDGVLSPTEAACALDVSRVYVYRLVWDGKLKSVKRKGQMAIPLRSIKAFLAAREESQRRRRRRTT
jgi:excisionase family DNA binding protein